MHLIDAIDGLEMFAEKASAFVDAAYHTRARDARRL
jgi:hypothetical protein